MELPRRILIGDGVLSQLGSFIKNLNGQAHRIAFLTGRIVKSRTEKPCKSSLFESSIGRRLVHSRRRFDEFGHKA